LKLCAKFILADVSRKKNEKVEAQAMFSEMQILSST